MWRGMEGGGVPVRRPLVEWRSGGFYATSKRSANSSPWLVDCIDSCRTMQEKKVGQLGTWCMCWSKMNSDNFQLYKKIQMSLN
jgi:hypothetical protein